MEKFNVGYGVASRAIDLLAHEGLVDRQHGSGTFVKDDVLEVLNATGASVVNWLDAFALVLSHSRWGFYPSLFQGVDAVAGDMHFQTIVCDTENDIGRQAMILMQLIDKRVAGIALVPTSQPETPAYQVRHCQESGIPVVLLHRQVQGVSAPIIALPFEEIGFQLGRSACQQGHRTVACVFDERYEATNRYEAGLRRALEECSDWPVRLSVHCHAKRTVLRPPEHEQFLAQTLTDILAIPRDRRPSVIVAIADDDAEWMYLRLMNMGVRVPEEMSLITIGNTARQREIDKQLTAITIDEAGIGRRAAHLLSEMRGRQRPINNNEQFTADIGFYAGRTLGPVP